MDNKELSMELKMYRHLLFDNQVAVSTSNYLSLREWLYNIMKNTNLDSIKNYKSELKEIDALLNDELLRLFNFHTDINDYEPVGYDRIMSKLKVLKEKCKECLNYSGEPESE